MGVLVAIGSAIAVVLGLLWRLNGASHAARGAIETADEARGFFRRLFWYRRANRHPMELLTDPREAVVAMMAAVAQYDGAITGNEQASIIRQIQQHFGGDERAAGEMFAHGRWLARDAGDLGAFLRRATPLLRSSCTPEQRRDLIAMLRDVARADGSSDTVIDHCIDQMAQSLRG